MIDRRALLAGLLASTAGAAGAQRLPGRPRGAAVGGFRLGSTAINLSWLDDAGASAGLWYGANSNPAWVYDAPTNRVLGVVQRYNYNNGTPLKENTALIYNMTTRVATLGGVIMTDDSTIVGTADQHGVGVLCQDAFGNWHSYGGGHNQPMKHSVSLDGGVTWAASGTFGTSYTYPHPVQVGNDQWVILREAPGGSTYPLVYHKGTSISPTTGSTTFGAKLPLIDLQTDTRVYAGTVVKVGTLIYIPFTRANAADSIRVDQYIAVLDTTTGALRNLSGSVSIAAGSLPLTRATADASFRLVDQTTGGTEESNTPAMWIDAEGIHLLYQAGVGGTTLRYARYSTAGALLEGPTDIGTVSYRYATPMIGPRPGGGVEVLFPKPAVVLDYDTSATFTRGGDIWRTDRPAGGGWTTATLVQACSGVHPFDSVARVEGAPADMRMVWCERAIDDADYATGGNCRTYGWGTGGIVTTPFVEDPDAAAYIGSAPYSAADRVVVTSAFRGFKTAGWWSVKGDLTYLMAEPFEATARKNIFGTYTLTDNGGAGNTFDPYLGLRGSATSKFDTGWNPTSAAGRRLTLTSHMMFLAATDESQAANWDIGNADAAGTLLLNVRDTTTQLRTRLADATTSAKTVGTSKFLALVQRVGTAKRMYARSVTSISSATVTATAFPNGSVYLGGNTTGTTQRRQALAGIGSAMGDPGPLLQVLKRYLSDRALL